LLEFLRSKGIGHIIISDFGASQGRKMRTGLYRFSKVGGHASDVSSLAADDSKINFGQGNARKLKFFDGYRSALDFNGFAGPGVFVKSFPVFFNGRKNRWFLQNRSCHGGGGLA